MKRLVSYLSKLVTQIQPDLCNTSTIYTPIPHYNLGNKLKDLGRLDEALTSYTKAILLRPDIAYSHYNLGNTLKDLRKLDKAEAIHNKAIALKPDFANAYWNLHGIQKTIKNA